MYRTMTAAAVALLIPLALAGQSPLADRSTGELLRMRRLLQEQIDSRQRAERAAESSAAAAEDLAQRNGRLIRGSLFKVVAPLAIERGAVEAQIAVAESLLSVFPVIPDSFVRSLVFVVPRTTEVDDALAPDERVLRRLDVEWPNWGNSDLDYGRKLTEPLLRVWQDQLHASWRKWLPWDLALEWTPLLNVSSVEDLTTPRWQIGARCLQRDASACRAWLGLDGGDEYVSRLYTSDERREWVRLYLPGNPEQRRRCLDGSDAVCTLIASARSQNPLPPIPASPSVRGALLRSMHATYGPGSLRALLDTTGTLGQRIERATGQPLDSVVLNARAWILGLGQPERVRAGASELTATLLFAALLVALATRSGRWR